VITDKCHEDEKIILGEERGEGIEICEIIKSVHLKLGDAFR